MKTVLVTGSAGFIGFHLCAQLLEKGYQVIGIDNLNDYYDVQLKKDRLEIISQFDNFHFEQIDLMQEDLLEKLFSKFSPQVVVNLAAQAGVRYSIENPKVYINSNIVGFSNIIEISKNYRVENFIFASSSSVYGANKKMPFSVSDNVDHPLSLYAASKKSNELIAHSYSSLFDLPVTGLRFFTVYGPYGRPDMALFLFTEAILKGEPIKIFNNGKMKRDFTYVGDIVNGIDALIERPAEPNNKWSGNSPDPASSYAPFEVFNIGNNEPVELMKFVGCIESELGIEAKKEFLPMQPGDVPETYADIDHLASKVGYRPNTPIEYGVKKFVDWYRQYYKF